MTRSSAEPYGVNPAVRRRLGELLRGARGLSSVSGAELAAELRISQSKISRIELGQVACSPELARRWATACAVSRERADEIAEAAEQVATDVVSGPWRRRRAGAVPRFQQRIARAESTTGVNLVWHPRLVPGLLQTPAYAREVMAQAHLGDAELTDAVSARMARQGVLYDPSRSIRILTGEAALRWPIRTRSTLVAQLDRLALFAGDGTVQFGIVPFSAPVGAFSYHGWSVMADRDDDEPDVVDIELETSVVYVSQPDDVSAYREAFERLAEVAFYGDDAAALIRRIRIALSEDTAE